jgi:hypothetical protein
LCRTVHNVNDTSNIKAKELSSVSNKLPPPPQPAQADQSLEVRVISKDRSLQPQTIGRAAETAQNKAPDLFGPPPLITGENVELYDALLQSARDDVKPADVIEEILVRDFVNLVWEAQRWRRLQR